MSRRTTRRSFLNAAAATAITAPYFIRNLRAAPPSKLGVRILLLSGEEIGVHGSWVYAAERFATPPTLPTSVVNLEFIGAAPDLGVFKSERFTLRSYAPDQRLLDRIDAVHRRLRHKPVYVSWYGAATEPRSRA